MAEEKYAMGIDFGTESGRAVLVNVRTGEEIATAVHRYSHGVITGMLPETGQRLEPDWALQDPQDYLEVLKNTVPKVIEAAGILPQDVIGLGIDFTASTLLPTLADGTPLCFLSEWRHLPHAWVKLWKHHAAQPEANRMTAIAREHASGLLDRYGGRVSSEWSLPKIWQMLNEAPQVYAAASRIIEAGDWVVWQLTGVETRASCAAGYKAFWSKRAGFPKKNFYKALDPRLENLADEKWGLPPAPLGQKAGGLSEASAAWLGLAPGTAVAVANVDAHVSVPAAGVVEPGRMVIIMGTSNCHMLLGDQEKVVPGMCGSVEDGIIPGFFGYEAGQSCVGDHFAWFVENCVPASCQQEAAQQGLDIHQLLERKASLLKPGESGLVALDWWNGNRSVLVDVDLTGLILGLTLQTKPEEIYRALIEATAFGTRMIIETFLQSGVPVKEIIATGGLPGKNKLLMQIYSDVTGMDVRVTAARQTSALGAAMFGAVAAGATAGGYESIFAAAQCMAHLRNEIYRPDPASHAVYDQLFAEYRLLHDTFGRGTNDVMKRLKALKAQVVGGNL